MDYPPYPDFDAWVITHRYSIAHKDGDAPYTLLHGYIKHTYCPISLHIRSNTTHFFVRGHHREPNAPDIHPYNLNNVHDHDLAVFFDFSPPDSNNIHATTITQLEQLTDPIDITRTLRALLRALYPRRTYDRINIVLSLLRSTIPPNCAQHPIEYHCFFLRDAKTKSARWANMDMIAEWIGQPAIIFGAFGEQRWSTNTAWYHIIQYIVQQYNTTVHTTTSVHHHVAQLRNAEQHRIPNLPTSIQHS